jgi:hypothetical protein
MGALNTGSHEECREVRSKRTEKRRRNSSRLYTFSPIRRLERGDNSRMPTAPIRPGSVQPTTSGETAAVLAAAVAPVQRPPVRWSGGVQHNANNPEVIDRRGRTYSSRPFAPQGVGFVRDGQPVPQHVFSSNKNRSGATVGQSLVLTNPGTSPVRLNVSMQVSEPRGLAPASTVVTVPAGGSVRVPAANANDTGFVAFKAIIEPADTPSREGKVHVDVVVHRPTTTSTAAELATQPLMETEGERGYRVPVGRLSENPQYLKELRFVMRGANVRPDPFTQTDAQVTAWAQEQARRGAGGQPNAFDPEVNRGILGRVNGLVSATAGEVQAEPLTVSEPGANNLVRIRPNANPPQLVGGRQGAANRDVGAYGKRITTTVPLRNTGSTPIRVAVRLATPPEGQDGAQIKGHQSYNGPVVVSATGATVTDVRFQAKLGQPGGSIAYERSAQIAIVTVPPGASVNLRVGLETHANSQFPLDLSVTRL